MTNELVLLMSEGEKVYNALQDLKVGTKEYGVTLAQWRMINEEIKSIEMHKAKKAKDELDRVNQEERKMKEDEKAKKEEAQKEIDRKERNSITKKDILINGIKLLEIISSVGLTVLSLKNSKQIAYDSMKFEETGSFTTQAGRSKVQDLIRGVKKERV